MDVAERLLMAAFLVFLFTRLFGRSDRSGAKRDGGKDVRVTVSYSPLREALEHRWSGVTRRQTKSLNPSAVFIILGRVIQIIVLKKVLTTGCSSVGVPECSPGSTAR